MLARPLTAPLPSYQTAAAGARALGLARGRLNKFVQTTPYLRAVVARAAEQGAPRAQAPPPPSSSPFRRALNVLI